MKRISIIGTVGVPGKYGGFETLADNLVRYHETSGIMSRLAVYCSTKKRASRPATYRTAQLRYVRLDANGVQSIPYDIVSMFDALRRGDDQLLLLGVSGALVLPFVRLFSRARVITNIDGIEWKRDKWNGLARFILRASEWAAVRFSHQVIADNQGIADYVTDTYGTDCIVIPYGGDHALTAEPNFSATVALPKDYALALCRIEPENNVAMILEAFAELDHPLVFVGNWDKSAYGRELKKRYSDHPSIVIHDPVYEANALRAIRDQARLYVHGHSAGGTNPSLVEMMHFSIPIFAHNCNFNRHTTEDRARYFETADELVASIVAMKPQQAVEIGSAMRKIACVNYTWERVGRDYFLLLEE